jgi:hypothetical protein
MARKGKLVQAVGYMRTSSATNVGVDKDSEKGQRAAIEGYARRPATSSLIGTLIERSRAPIR